MTRGLEADSLAAGIEFGALRIDDFKVGDDSGVVAAAGKFHRSGSGSNGALLSGRPFGESGDGDEGAVDISDGI